MNKVINSSLLEGFNKDTQPLRGLPGSAYTSEEFRKLENLQIFSKKWVFVGFAHQIPKTGDASPITVADQPILLIRNKKNEVNAFHNVCRHRNLQLVDKPSNCGRMIRCPYHSWTYDLEGQLRGTPYFGGDATAPVEGFDMQDNNLLTVNCEVWHDWIFVNLDKNPEPFDDFLTPIKTVLSDTDISQYKPIAILEFGEVACNWKLLMENFIEPYHVQFVHNDTTAQPLQDHYPVIEETCLGSAVDLSEEQVANADEGTLGVTSRYLTLFPNFVMGTYQPDKLGIHLNIPVNAETTIQYRVIYAHQDSSYSPEEIDQLKTLWHSVHLEDHEMTERLQKGRHSKIAEQGGLLSPHWETSVRKFQELIAKSISPALKD
ncbi:MAG: aromatic ring-hydroxylating dioxygenase subunit alpha [Cocleimonas sp.]